MRLPFVLILAAHALGAMSLLTVLSAGPQIMVDLRLSAVQIGALASFYSAALAAASVPGGLATDRIGTRAALVLSALLITLGLALAGLAQGFGMLGAGVALCGAGYGLINPAAGRAVTLWFSPDWRVTLMSLKQTGVPIGAGLGTGFALVGGATDWRLGVLAAAVLTASLALLFRAALPARDDDTQRASGITSGSDPVPAHDPPPRARDVLSYPGLIRASLAAALTNGIQFALWAHLPTLLRGEAQLGAADLALCLGALHAGTLLGRLGWGLLTDRALAGDAARGLRLLCLLGLLGALALGMLALRPELVLAVLACLLLGASLCSAVGLHVALTAALVPARQLAGGLGVTMLAVNLGGAILPLGFGAVLAVAGAGGAGALLIVTILLALALLPRLPRAPQT
ncbi:MAG: MFS transporter [Roseinatronobacter sp.]